MPIVTLDALRAHLGIPAGESAENARLWTALLAADSEAERFANRRFLPHYATRNHAASGTATLALALADDLLEVVSVSDGSNGLLTGLGLAPDAAPHDRLLRTDGGLFDTGLYSVSGVWGWHDGSAGVGWQATGQTVSSGVAAGDVLLSVPDADALTVGGTLFEVGALLRVGAEFMAVLAADAALNRLTVSRAAQGSTATAHSAGTAIHRWQPAPLVSAWVLRRAAALYRAADGGGTPAFEGDVLRGVRRLTVRG